MKEIKIYWHSSTPWNEICANIIEQFGLPGNRYVTYTTTDCLSVVFEKSEDAFLCKLFLSEHL